MKSLAILVAEDETLTRLDIRGMLERAGHVICGECGNGRKAVELARQLSPDLALLDIMMPELDGVGATRRIRGLAGAAAQVPILAITANADPWDAANYLAQGMDGVVEKPIKAERLLSAINGLFLQDTESVAA